MFILIFIYFFDSISTILLIPTLRMVTAVGADKQYPIERTVDAMIINHTVGKVTNAIPRHMQIIPIMATEGIAKLSVLTIHG